MYTTRHDDANALYIDVLEELTNDDADYCEVAPRGQPCREMLARTLVLEDPTRNVVTLPERKLNYYFMVAEWLWVIGGRDDVASIAPYNKRIADFSDDGATFFGAYGPRVVRDIYSVINLLRRDPDTRQGVLSPWRPESLTVPTKDVPCTLTLQAFVRDGELDLHVNMRSNDAWLGLPYDIFNFTQIQRTLACELGVIPGFYVHHVGSLHLYERDRAVARALVDAYRDGAVPQPEESPAVSLQQAAILSKFTSTCALGGIAAIPANDEYAALIAHRFNKDYQLMPFFKKLVP